MTVPSPMAKLGDALRQNTLVKIVEKFGEKSIDCQYRRPMIDRGEARTGHQGSGSPGRQLRARTTSRPGSRARVQKAGAGPG